jgi:hypothetical protein
MVLSDPLHQSLNPNLAWPQPQLGSRPLPGSGYYRVAAFPAAYAITDDVIIVDDSGCSFLLSEDAPTPTPLERAEVDMLGMFYEPSQDYSWHSLEDLRRIIYGSHDDA